MKRFVLAALLLVVTTILRAAEPTPAPPKIDVKATYAVHEPIVATVQGGASLYLWDDTTGFEAIELDGGKTLHIWAKPGQYRLRCRLLVVDWEKKSFASTRVSAAFVVQGLLPEPDPVPPNPPVPPPLPIKIAALYVIYETKDATPAVADMKDDKAWKDTLDAAKIPWRVMDDEAADKVFPNATKLARDKGLPAIVLISPSRDSTVIPLPKDKTAMRVLVNQYAGGVK